jgi:hypothetical protein
MLNKGHRMRKGSPSNLFIKVSIAMAIIFSGSLHAVDSTFPLKPRGGPDPRQCTPTAKDFQYNGINRFHTCDGRDQNLMFDRSISCQNNIYNLFAFIDDHEKENNFCKISSDCGYSLAAGIPLHVNKGKVFYSFWRLQKVAEFVADSCMTDKIWPGTDVSRIVLPDDLKRPTGYTCIAKRCVPKFEKDPAPLQMQGKIFAEKDSKRIVEEGLRDFRAKVTGNKSSSTKSNK